MVERLGHLPILEVAYHITVWTPAPISEAFIDGMNPFRITLVVHSAVAFYAMIHS
jgi:hypothetical protein